MGRQDEYQFSYLDDDRRFADQVNGALFHGRQVVRPEELVQADHQMVYLGMENRKRNSFRTVVDKVRLWKGRLLHIFVVDNQNYVDYRMVFRAMLSESLGYQKQWKRKKRTHERNRDFKNDADAFLSGMKREEKFTPIITLVVYYGMAHPWNGPKSLYELLEIDDELKPFVTNYRLNLYDCHEHDSFENYHTELRQVFEILRYGRDKEALQRVMSADREAYSGLDTETREFIEVVAKVKLPEEDKIMGNGTEKYNMLGAFEEMRQEGIVIGRQDGIAALVNSLKDLLPDADAVYQAVIRNEVYKCLTKEEVLQYY